MFIYILQFLYVSIFSTFLHFAYDITNHIFIFSIIGAVNESTWEHLKLGIFPWFTWFFIRSYFFSYINSYFGNLIAIVTYMITICAIFYGSIFIMKRHILLFSISSFYAAVISGSFFEYLIKDYSFNPFFEIIGFTGCILIILLGLVWTYYPAKNFLTVDVRYRMYGIDAHKKRCDIIRKKKYIVYIFNLLGISFPKNDYFEENSKYYNDEKVGFRKKNRKINIDCKKKRTFAPS